MNSGGVTANCCNPLGAVLIVPALWSCSTPGVESCRTIDFVFTLSFCGVDRKERLCAACISGILDASSSLVATEGRI